MTNPNVQTQSSALPGKPRRRGYDRLENSWTITPDVTYRNKYMGLDYVFYELVDGKLKKIEYAE
jgi:hypothetical protein